MSFVQGPVAPENNPPIEPQWFQPSQFSINAISYGTSTTITTNPAFGVNNNYVLGQLVRVVIPPTYGASQLNGQLAYVIGLPGTNQITVNINTTNGYDAFIASPAYGPTPPQVLAVGDINSGPINLIPTELSITIPGAFENISPGIGVTP